MICIEYVLYKKENQTCLQSASARGLWIEIRGNWLELWRWETSASARGLWIEIYIFRLYYMSLVVSFREGAVD